ncbi:hypothetical protein F6U93_13540 [Tamlana haliotis]|uniref:Secretion system C-terminal sorting domain-containing protein n=1 Tax=Pseudotamlana haliotis TaxID=2614804 RepID=A0A6N6MDE6_9FLAO|nr:hypothetical protein [Tamlana haliotis]KAB1066871.1 hypothetical protein F6U93_13540 [Tamlana haliotis]
MNNILTKTRKGFLMVTLFATLLSFANETSFYNVNVEANKTTLTLNYAKAGSALSIKDVAGSVLYSETIATTGSYKREFDLTFLPNGNYLFEVEKDLEIKEIPFTLTEGVANFNKNEEKLVYKPFVRVSNDIVYISKLAIDGEDLKVEIFYTEKNRSNSELVISEQFSNENSIQKAYKLEGLNNGSYEIVLHSANRTYIKNI